MRKNKSYKGTSRNSLPAFLELTHSIIFSIIDPMSTAEKLLANMRNNPRDWRIENLIAVAGKYGIEVRNHGGSHHIFSFPGIELVVTVPAHRPIKPVYIKQFVSLIDQARGKPL